MNQLIITDCNECNDHCPLDSWGCGTGCVHESNTPRIVSVETEEAPIPDWCPKLKEQQDRT